MHRGAGGGRGPSAVLTILGVTVKLEAWTRPSASRRPHHNGWTVSHSKVVQDAVTPHLVHCVGGEQGRRACSDRGKGEVGRGPPPPLGNVPPAKDATVAASRSRPATCVAREHRAGGRPRRGAAGPLCGHQRAPDQRGAATPYPPVPSRHAKSPHPRLSGCWLYGSLPRYSGGHGGMGSSPLRRVEPRGAVRTAVGSGSRTAPFLHGRQRGCTSGCRRRRSLTVETQNRLAATPTPPPCQCRRRARGERPQHTHPLPP